MHGYRAGREHAADMRLDVDRLPRNAFAARAITERIALLMGLRFGAGSDTRPLPLSCAFACELMGWDPVRDKSRANRTLKMLVERRVLQVVGSLPSQYPDRENWEGTRCFEPYGTTLKALLDPPEFPVEDGIGVPELGGADVQRDPAFIESVAQPAPKVEHEPVMDRTEAAETDDLGMVTALSAASAHVTNGTDQSGGIEADIVAEFGAVEDGAELDALPESVAVACANRVLHAGREWRKSPRHPWCCRSCHPPVDDDVEWRRDQ